MRLRIFSVWLTASAAPANPNSAESQIARTGTSFLLKGRPSRTHPLGLLDSFTQTALLYPADSTRQGGTSWICTTFSYVMRKRSTTQATIFAGFPPAHRLNYARMPSETAQRSCGRKEADELQRKSGAAGLTRTPDLVITNHPLCQLSYSSISAFSGPCPWLSPRSWLSPRRGELSRRG